MVGCLVTWLVVVRWFGFSGLHSGLVWFGWLAGWLADVLLAAWLLAWLVGLIREVSHASTNHF